MMKFKRAMDWGIGIFVGVGFYCLGLTQGCAEGGYTDLLAFSGTTGSYIGASPRGSLTAYVDNLGNQVLYGMTYAGGTGTPPNDYVYGTLFSYNPATGVYANLVNLSPLVNSVVGAHPAGSLTVFNGNLYGMTSAGSGNAAGNIFIYYIGTNTYADQVNFMQGNACGAYPLGSFIVYNGLLYGLTSAGGYNNTSCNIDNMGVLFSFADYTNLVNFMQNGANGATPKGSLLAYNDLLYGMTSAGGGTNNGGVLFSYDPILGSDTDLLNFNGTQGATPLGSLIAYNGLLYGMTSEGGANDLGVIFSYNPATGAYTDLFDFNGNQGASPKGDLLAYNGLLYGMTSAGGANGNGVIFSYDPATGTYLDLLDFSGTSGPSPGATPTGSLIPYNGLLYGMTSAGGANALGVLFSFFPPPGGITGYQKKNDCGLEYELFNVIKWQANPAAVGYYVYRDGVLIATLNASTLEYQDHNRKRGAQTLYSVSAFNGQGAQSASATIALYP